MKTCENCPDYHDCIEICLPVKKLIPAIEAGRNSDREVLMRPADLSLAADLNSFTDWNGERTRTSYPALDLSILSFNERHALRLIADGLSYADAAIALKVSRSTVQSYMARARAKFHAVQNRHIVRTQKNDKGGASL